MRDLSTYRGARRNACLREDKRVWGPSEYYAGHDGSAHRSRRRAKRGRLAVQRSEAKGTAPVKRVATRAPAINKAAPRGQ